MDVISLNTRALSDSALDWATATALQLRVSILPPHYGTGPRVFVKVGSVIVSSVRYSPTTCWKIGGELIAKYNFSFTVNEADGTIEASAPGMHGIGRNHLEAVCRAIVSSVAGDKCNVPVELAA